jgi:hypothetical protein
MRTKGRSENDKVLSNVLRGFVCKQHLINACSNCTIQLIILVRRYRLSLKEQGITSECASIKYLLFEKSMTEMEIC